MRDAINLELNNDPAISTTRNNMTVDVEFNRHIDRLTTTFFLIIDRSLIIKII